MRSIGWGTGRRTAASLIPLLAVAILLCPQAATVHAQQSGFPGESTINSTGYALVPMIEQAAQFKNLSHGIVYHVDPWRSFGYEWGVGKDSNESITLFSPNNESYITTWVDLRTNQITSMGFANDTGVANPGGLLRASQGLQPLSVVVLPAVIIAPILVASPYWLLAARRRKSANVIS